MSSMGSTSIGLDCGCVASAALQPHTTQGLKFSTMGDIEIHKLKSYHSEWHCHSLECHQLGFCSFNFSTVMSKSLADMFSIGLQCIRKQAGTVMDLSPVFLFKTKYTSLHFNA